MAEPHVIYTPENIPADKPWLADVVGKCLMGDGVCWYCDSYDPHIGYWMTPLVPDQMRYFSDRPAARTNVSERAIRGMWWPIYIDTVPGQDTWVTCQHTVPSEIKALLRDEAKREATILACRATIEQMA